MLLSIIKIVEWCMRCMMFQKFPYFLDYNERWFSYVSVHLMRFKLLQFYFKFYRYDSIQVRDGLFFFCCIQKIEKDAFIDIMLSLNDQVNNNMIQSSSQNYEYHITILSVKMKVKFPCRMKIEHQGSVLTGQSSPGEDNRYIFNQLVILKDQNHQQFFEIAINLVTEKGAKYIAGVIKLYQSELVRSEGERIVLSLAKCIDGQAFCEIRVDQIVSIKSNKHVPYDRKSTVHRDVPVRQRQVIDMDFSPHKSAYNVKIQQSKSQYQFPLHQNGRGIRNDWDTKSKSRMNVPPQTAFPKSKNSNRINYANNVDHGLNGLQMMGESGMMMSRQKVLQGEVYKQGYQKLKQKYKKQAELNKQELNKRLALQNNENNLKLQIMRLKMKCDQQQKGLLDKNSKLKELQGLLANFQQKQSENIYLKEEVTKKDGTIRVLEDKIRGINRSLEQFKDLAYEKNSEESNRNKELQIELQNLRIRFQTRERQLQKQNKGKVQLLHEKEMELVSKSDSLQRQRKTVGDLEKVIQNKQFQLQKLIQNERNSNKSKIQDQKLRYQKLQREYIKLQDVKKQLSKELQLYKSNVVKLQYDKKLLSQQLQSLKSDYFQAKNYKDKYIQLSRDNRSIIQERTHLQRQLQRTIQNKQMNLSQISKQFQDQMEYYKKMNRQLDEKVKNQGNKLIQVQGQLEMSRSQQDKLRRNLQSAMKEIADSKQKQKSVRKTLKIKEQQSLSTQTELATLRQKLKSIDQIYKLQVDKFKQEIDKMRVQYENEVDKSEEMHQLNNQLNVELNKIRIKLQYAEERVEKDGLNLKQKQVQVQSLIKDYEEQINVLEQSVNGLRLGEKELVTKLQKSELQQIKNQEKMDKMKKEIKVLEERCNHLDGTLKTKINQIQILTVTKDNLEKKLGQLQLSQAQLKNQGSMSLAEKNKLSKINDMITQEIKRAKTENTQLVSVLTERQKQQQQLRSILKTQKEQYAKLDVKYNTYKKQVQRSKDILFQTIQKWLFTLPLGGKDENKRNVELLLERKPTQNSFGEYFNMMISHAKEIKQCLGKQFELIKQLQRQKERLQEQLSVSGSKYQNTELTLKKQIDQLQLQLQNVIEQKQIQITSYGQNIDELEQKIRELIVSEQELNNQLEQLNFTNNSMKMDYEAMNEQNGKKIANLRKVNAQLQEKLEYQVMTVSDLDEKCGLLQTDVDNLQLTVQNLNEANTKKDKLIEELREVISVHQRNAQQFKRNKKQLTERIVELEMHLNTEKELNDKNRQMMAEQESKTGELKLFISNLMKQKEIAIRSDLQKSENLMVLQAGLSQVNKELELMREENDKNVKNVEMQKEVNRKLNANLKDLQNQKKQQKNKNLKLQQKLREKQKQIQTKEQLLKKLQVKSQKAIQKLKSQLRQLQQQFQLKNNHNFEQTKDTNEKIIHLEGQIQKKNSSISTLQAKIAQFQQTLFAQKQKNIHNEQLISKLKNQNQQFRTKIYSMDTNLNDKQDELNSKQEKLFQFSGRVYSLEHKLQALQQEHQQILEYMNREFNNKYDSLLQEYEQRLDLIQKQRDYLKNLCEQRDKDIVKLNAIIKSQELSENSNRKNYQEKIKKLEDDRLALLSIKNTQLQRASEENKSLLESNKVREAENRRIVNQLEVARKTITNLDLKAKDYDEKIKGVNRVYQTELEQLKKKDVASRAYKEAIINYHWNIQRQIKKGVQNFIKNFLEISEDKNSQKILDLARGLQKSFVQALSNKPQQK